MAKRKNNTVGQGSTEYLVIFAIVLLISLVAIGLLGFFPSMSSDAGKSASDAYWRSSAFPIRVVESTFRAGAACGFDNSSTYSLVIHNAETREISLKEVYLNGQSGQFCDTNTNAPAEQIVVGPSDTYVIDVIIPSSVESPCSNGKVASVALSFTYGTLNIDRQLQEGEKTLMVTCPPQASSSSAAGGGGDSESKGNGIFCGGVECSGREECMITGYCPYTSVCSLHGTLPFARVCSLGESCAPGDSCDSGLSCISGTCQVPCSGVTFGECSEPAYCFQSQACPFAYSCITGTPWEAPLCCDVDTECNELDTCCAGSTCTKNKCTLAEECGGATYGYCKDEKMTCALKTVCPTIYECTETPVKPPLKCCDNGQECSSADTCCDGTCDRGVCAVCTPLDGSCRDVECCSGLVCSENRCIVK